MLFRSLGLCDVCGSVVELCSVSLLSRAGLSEEIQARPSRRRFTSGACRLRRRAANPVNFPQRLCKSSRGLIVFYPMCNLENYSGPLCNRSSFIELNQWTEPQAVSWKLLAEKKEVVGEETVSDEGLNHHSSHVHHDELHILEISVQML